MRRLISTTRHGGLVRAFASALGLFGCSDTPASAPNRALESMVAVQLLGQGAPAPQHELWLKAAMVRMCDDYGWSERERACLVTKIFASDMFDDSELDRRVADIGCGYVYLADGERLEYSFEMRSWLPRSPGKWNACHDSLER